MLDRRTQTILWGCIAGVLIVALVVILYVKCDNYECQGPLLFKYVLCWFVKFALLIIFIRHAHGNSKSISHAGTVVPECFKDDNASQWKSGKFDPRSLKNPRTDRHLNLHG